MSLRFACPNCRQKLSVGAHKAGTNATCPKCKKSIVIPKPSPHSHPPGSADQRAILPSGLVQVPVDVNAAVASPTQSMPAATSVLEAPPSQPHAGASLLGMNLAPPAPAEPPPSDFDAYMVYDDDTEIVYDTDQPPPTPGQAPSIGDRLLVPRWVVYAQGIVLAVVAVISFVIGILTGGGGSAPAVAAGPKECKLFGTVSFELAGDKKTDDGAVVIALPTKASVDEKADSAELSPKKTVPPPTHRSLQIIRQLGGAYARTDRQGKYELKLPQTGPYYVLVVSNNVKQKSGDDEKALDLMQMGKFLEQPMDLLDKQRYQWTVANLRGDQRLDASFD